MKNDKFKSWQTHFDANTLIYCLGNIFLHSFSFLIFKRIWGGGDPCGFSKNVSSREGVKLNIIINHIFPENFIESPQVVRRYENFLRQF